MISTGIAAVASGLLTLAGGPIQCTVTKAPVINVQPRTTEVRYDYSRSSADLTAVQSDTISPFAPGTKTVTEGLRQDQPVLTASISEQLMTYPEMDAVCLSYETINIYIDLKPVIFIASEWPPGTCRDAILEHEKKHIRVDREVMNEFAQKIGAAVQNAVNEVGAVGPVHIAQKEEAHKYMLDYIDSAVKYLQLPLYSQMRKRQAEVDSLQEYQRIGAICGHR